MNYDELLRDMERALVAIDASKPYRYEPTTSLPALSPQMQAALDAEAGMVASVVKRACEMVAELEDVRADLREAMELLRAYGQPHYWVGLKEAIGWNASYRKLMEKHKETP